MIASGPIIHNAGKMNYWYVSVCVWKEVWDNNKFYYHEIYLHRRLSTDKQHRRENKNDGIVNEDDWNTEHSAKNYE